MTKELAIRIITGDVLGTSEQTQEAVTMAVKALSVPSAQPYLLDEWCIDCKEYDHKKHCCPRYNRVIRDAMKMRKRGKWIERESGTEDKENGFETVIVCSCCDFPATTFYSEDCESRTQIRTDFCPNCGADMRGEQ